METHQWILICLWFFLKCLTPQISWISLHITGIPQLTKGLCSKSLSVNKLPGTQITFSYWNNFLKGSQANLQKSIKLKFIGPIMFYWSTVAFCFQLTTLYHYFLDKCKRSSGNDSPFQCSASACARAHTHPSRLPHTHTLCPGPCVKMFLTHQSKHDGAEIRGRALAFEGWKK